MMDTKSLIDRAAERQKWIGFGQKLLNLCVEIQRGADVKITKKGFYEHKILSLALLSRTYMNLKGVIVLAQAGLVVEIRVLARCCYENLIYAARLIEKREEFVSQMIDDDVKSTRSRGEFILDDIAELDPLDKEAADQLRGRIQQLKNHRPKARLINTKEAWRDSVMKPAYLFYSQLSGDSAHPSITALKRHVVTHIEGGEKVLGLDIHPVERGAEIGESVNITCNAVLGTCVAVNEILEFTDATSLLTALTKEYAAIGGRVKKQGPRT